MWPAGLCLAWFLCLLWPGRGPCAHCSVLRTVCVQGRGSCCWSAKGVALRMMKQTRGYCEVIWSFPLPLGGIVPALDYLYRPPAEEIAQAPSVSHACVLRPSRSVSFF